MRIALIATSVAALAAVPFAIEASGPRMESEEFLAAVRCVAFENLTSESATLAAERRALNVEARRQPVENAVRARAEVAAASLAARDMASGDERAIRSEACTGASARFATRSPGSA